MELKVVELFAGVGGFRVGLNKIKEVDMSSGNAVENGEWDFVWANQYEPSTKVQHAYDCYTRRFGEGSCSNIDINKVNKTEIPDHALLVGGFPCQDYSVARSLSNEKGIQGKKGVLFWDIKNVIKAKHPRFILLENVDRLLKSPSNMRGRDFAIMLKTFDHFGYNVVWRVINAAEFGMPQKRRRVFIFAFDKDSKYSEEFICDDVNYMLKSNILNRNFPINEESYKVVETDLNEYKDILDVSNKFSGGKFLNSGLMTGGKVYHFDFKSVVEDLYTLGDVLDKAKTYISSEDKLDCIVESDKLEKWEYLKGSKRIERTAQNGHKYIYSEGKMNFPDDLNSPARTMLTSEGTLNRSSHIIFDKEIKKYRILTPVECEYIQMFPPNWTKGMPIRRRYFMMGNALVTGIVTRLENDLRQIIKNE